MTRLVADFLRSKMIACLKLLTCVQDITAFMAPSRPRNIRAPKEATTTARMPSMNPSAFLVRPEITVPRKAKWVRVNRVRQVTFALVSSFNYCLRLFLRRDEC